jgi:hypothetical protein
VERDGAGVHASRSAALRARSRWLDSLIARSPVA